jgi:hypothetical protein
MAFKILDRWFLSKFRGSLVFFFSAFKSLFKIKNENGLKQMW